MEKKELDFTNFLEHSQIGLPGNEIGCKYHYTTIKAVRGIIENNNI